MTALPGYSEIDPAHGEDEFILSDFTATASTVMPSAADTPVSRLDFQLQRAAPSELLLSPGVPADLLDHPDLMVHLLPPRLYPSALRAAATNILLFIAFSWSLAGNDPRQSGCVAWSLMRHGRGA